MNAKKIHVRHCMLHYFHRGKTAAEATRIIYENYLWITYDDNVAAEKTCRDWFAWFKSGDFDVSDRLRSGQPEKFKDKKLQVLVDENIQHRHKQSLQNNLKWLKPPFPSDCMRWGKNPKGKKVGAASVDRGELCTAFWHLSRIVDKTTKEEFFVQIIIDDEKWIYYNKA